MSSFTRPLQVKPVDDKWELLEDFEYWTRLEPGYFAGWWADKYRDKPFYIQVKKGTQTDFGTIPRWIWWLLPPYHPDYGKATVIHDECYRQAMFNKEWADAVFFEAMEVLGAPKWKRIIMYHAVRLFGKGNYDAE